MSISSSAIDNKQMYSYNLQLANGQRVTLVWDFIELPDDVEYQFQFFLKGVINNFLLTEVSFRTKIFEGAADSKQEASHILLSNVYKKKF